MRSGTSNRGPRLGLALFVAWAALPGVAFGEETSSLEARLAVAEARLDLIDRKFALLGAKDEAELLGAGAAFGDPEMLKHLAQQEIDQSRWELGYRYLASLRALHPEASLDSEVFRNAAILFRRAYFRNRLVKPESVWLTSEPAFLFHWLEGFSDGAFPQEQASYLLTRMPVDFLRRYEAWAQGRPKLGAWTLRFEKDNGIVQSIEAIARTPAGD